MAEPTAAPHLVLASSSPRRAALLARLGLAPEVRPVDVDESPSPGEIPVTLARRLAAAKADAGVRLGGRHDDPSDDPSDVEVVLAADTVVVLGGRALGKPRDRDEAAAMLHALAGRTHEVVTGVAVHRGDQRLATHVQTRVHVRALTGTEIAWYVGTGEADDKAGAYGLQGAGAVLVDRIEGSDTNVIGLPLAQTVQLLRVAGVEVCGDPG